MILRMGDGAIEIRLELSLAGDSVTGSARNGNGLTRQFDGRLGLLAAIDALLATSTTSPEASSESQ